MPGKLLNTTHLPGPLLGLGRRRAHVYELRNAIRDDLGQHEHRALPGWPNLVTPRRRPFSRAAVARAASAVLARARRREAPCWHLFAFRENSPPQRSAMDDRRSAAPASRRVRLNVGGKRFETTVGTLTQGGDKSLNFFSSIVRHEPPAEGEEIFIDRDGEAFGPLLSYLRTGCLHIPPGVSEAAVRCEAEFYCIQLEEPPAVGLVRAWVRLG